MKIRATQSKRVEKKAEEVAADTVHHAAHPWGIGTLPPYMVHTIGTLPVCTVCGTTAGIKRYGKKCAPCADRGGPGPEHVE